MAGRPEERPIPPDPEAAALDHGLAAAFGPAPRSTMQHLCVVTPVGISKSARPGVPAVRCSLGTNRPDRYAVPPSPEGLPSSEG
jgi:hypothetical protein